MIVLVAVPTQRMALLPFLSTVAASTGVPLTLHQREGERRCVCVCVCVCVYLWSPASLFGGPADLSLAHATADPITAVFLLHHYLTRWTVHSVPSLQQLLQDRGACTAAVIQWLSLRPAWPGWPWPPHHWQLFASGRPDTPGSSYPRGWPCRSDSSPAHTHTHIHTHVRGQVLSPH